MELDTSSIAGFVAVGLLTGVLLDAVFPSVGDAVVELPVSELLLNLSGDCGLPVDGDCLNLLDDLVSVLPLWDLLLPSITASCSITSSRLSISVLLSV